LTSARFAAPEPYPPKVLWWSQSTATSTVPSLSSIRICAVTVSELVLYAGTSQQPVKQVDQEQASRMASPGAASAEPPERALRINSRGTAQVSTTGRKESTVPTPPASDSPDDRPALEPIRVLRPRRTDALAQLLDEIRQDKNYRSHESVAAPVPHPRTGSETQELRLSPTTGRNNPPHPAAPPAGRVPQAARASGPDSAGRPW
jgi:hypothetical protein